MELTSVQTAALGGFVGALAFGAIAGRTHFCAMGAVSDWVHMGDKTRLRTWFLAIGVAILGTQGLAALTPLDLRQSMYLTPSFSWLGHALGGVLFGIGMTLAGGCGQRNLVRLGGGNLKSLVVLLVLAVTAYMTMRGLLALVRSAVFEPLRVDLSAHGIADQSIPHVLSAFIGSEHQTALRWIAAGVVAFGLIGFALKSAEFRRRADQYFAGSAIGLLVIAGWYITGVLGTDDFEPARIESYTFVGPVAEALQYLMTYTGANIDFGIAAVLGVVAGSFLSALAVGKFRVETFTVRSDMIAHVAGGALMGFGGVVALGCTIGQGITGMSTLALGAAVTLGAIVFGSALTLKVQYHRLDEHGFWRALYLALADLRLAPTPRPSRPA